MGDRLTIAQTYKHETFNNRIWKYFPSHTQYLALKLLSKEWLSEVKIFANLTFAKMLQQQSCHSLSSFTKKSIFFERKFKEQNFDETSWCYQERRKLPNWQPPAYPDQLLVPDVKGEGHGHLQPLLQHVQLGMGLSWYNRYQGNFTSVYIYVVSFSLHIYKV